MFLTQLDELHQIRKLVWSRTSSDLSLFHGQKNCWQISWKVTNREINDFGLKVTNRVRENISWFERIRKNCKKIEKHFVKCAKSVANRWISQWKRRFGHHLQDLSSFLAKKSDDKSKDALYLNFKNWSYDIGFVDNKLTVRSFTYFISASH